MLNQTHRGPAHGRLISYLLFNVQRDIFQDDNKFDIFNKKNTEFRKRWNNNGGRLLMEQQWGATFDGKQWGGGDI